VIEASKVYLGGGVFHSLCTYVKDILATVKPTLKQLKGSLQKCFNSKLRPTPSYCSAPGNDGSTYASDLHHELCYSNPHMARTTAFDPSSAFTSPT
jgi:hypothetical protein